MPHTQIFRRRGRVFGRQSGILRGMLGWLLRQDAGNVLFVIIATALLAWFVWTFL
jgi:hypothetical protein